MLDLPSGDRERAGPAHARPSAGGAAQLAVLLSSFAACVLTVGIPAALLPAIAADVGVDPNGVVVALLVVVPAGVTAVLSPVAGRFIDAFGRTPLLAAGLALNGVAGTAPLWLDGIGPVIASRAVVGVADAIIGPCVITLLGDRYRGSDRARVFALYLMTALAFGLLSQVWAAVAGQAGWRVPFVLHAVGVLLAVLVVMIVRERRGFTRAGARLPPLEWGRLRAPFAVMLLAGTINFTPVVGLVPRLDEVQAHPGLAGGLAASVGTLLGTVLAGWLCRLGPGRLLPVALALAGVGTADMAFAPTGATIIVGMTVASVGTGLMLPPILTWAVGGMNLLQRGRSVGWCTGAFMTGLVVVPMLVLGVGRQGLQPVLLGVGLAALALAVMVPRLIELSERHPG